jgi:hypothetical protein
LVDFDDSQGKSLRGFLRQPVAYAPVRSRCSYLPENFQGKSYDPERTLNVLKMSAGTKDLYENYISR